ncbi:MAG: phage holin family protein, partial [Bacteroidetes bacterium]|nr:phage holin family protein [Bacteroidota bacterium]
MNFIVKLLLYSVAIMITSYLLPGVEVEGFTSAIILSAVLALLNITLKPIMVILTIPFTIITFGLFLIVINAVNILIADALIDGVYISGFWWAVIFSLVVT